MKFKNRRMIADKYLRIENRYKRVGLDIPNVSKMAKFVGVSMHLLKVSLEEFNIPYNSKRLKSLTSSNIEIGV